MKNYIRNCTFSYKCNKKWEELIGTNSQDIKFCMDCQREVYFCNTDEKLREAIVLNRCVAVTLSPVLNREGETYLGLPF